MKWVLYYKKNRKMYHVYDHHHKDKTLKIFKEFVDAYSFFVKQLKKEELNI